jgi:adenosine kinase
VIALKMSGLPKASGTRPRVVVITQGGQPTILSTLGQVTSYAVEPLANELLVDINGAGDAFVGGFIAKLVQGSNS